MLPDRAIFGAPNKAHFRGRVIGQGLIESGKQVAPAQPNRAEHRREIVLHLEGVLQKALGPLPQFGIVGVKKGFDKQIIRLIDHAISGEKSAESFLGLFKVALPVMNQHHGQVRKVPAKIERLLRVYSGCIDLAHGLVNVGQPAIIDAGCRRQLDGALQFLACFPVIPADIEDEAPPQPAGLIARIKLHRPFDGAQRLQAAVTVAGNERFDRPALRQAPT